MQHRERDPKAIVRQLLQTERNLPSGAREEVLALGADAVPTLLQVLDDDESGGWAQIHAVRLLGEMKISAAIGGILRALAETDALDVLHDAILVSMPEIGDPVVEPALRAYAETVDLELSRKHQLHPVAGRRRRRSHLRRAAGDARERAAPCG
ncbi:MAG: hypothetical protein ABIY55_26950 [Kofleriaceae bacterium]